ncbi:MAG TPA: NB-ARC domain-containing protein [Burkholderiales bacterium]|nr:NB-ARC domain-containing protein [Burkholderiales bacterium]
MTSFIGRKRERVEVAALLAKSRLVTLQGTGGMGKTRLALQVAADSLDAFPDGVWVVELAALKDPRLVPRTVASVLGVSEKADQTLVETLANAIGDRRSLIVLDNCEHLISACAEIAYALLRRTNGMRIIATSREALRVDGEQVYRVASLSMPARGATTSTKSCVPTPPSSSSTESVCSFPAGRRRHRRRRPLPTYANGSMDCHSRWSSRQQKWPRSQSSIL